MAEAASEAAAVMVAAVAVALVVVEAASVVVAAVVALVAVAVVGEAEVDLVGAAAVVAEGVGSVAGEGASAVAEEGTKGEDPLSGFRTFEEIVTPLEDEPVCCLLGSVYRVGVSCVVCLWRQKGSFPWAACLFVCCEPSSKSKIA